MDKKETGGSAGNGRRQRAPTITIDTTAVSDFHSYSVPESIPLQSLPNASLALAQEDQEDESLDPRTQTSPTESYSHARTSAGSRPTSPYNSLLSNARINEMPSNFLAVPGSRSRANSTDSEDEYLSATSVGGDTVVGASNSSKGQNLREVPESFDNGAIINDPDALKEDPGTEKDFKVEDNRFAFTPGQLAKLLNPKSLSAFYALGGLEGIEKGLRTDRRSGISNDEYTLEGTIPFESIHRGVTGHPETSEGNHVTATNTASSSHANDRAEDKFSDRKRIFGDNRLPERKPKSIFALAWIAYNDKVLIILTVAAVISLALGLYQTFQPHPNGEARIEWVEGVAIVVAIVIVVVVGAGNDFQKERQFVRLNKKKEDRYVQVVRSGKPMEVSVYDIYAGDVMNLEAGDLIPVDGIFISGHNVKCDESSATGESDLCKKQPGDQVYRAIRNNEDVKKLDPFIVSGGKVSEGVGTFLVTSVGIHSSYGKTMLSLQVETEATPLQSKLNTLAEYIAKLGGAAGLLLFVVTLIKFLAKLPQNHATPSQKAQQFLQIFIVAVTIVVVAVPEGLPLAVTLALAFATTRMLKDNNLVRVLRACETMGNATTICSDKTGTLTQNKMSVVAATFGTSSRFGDRHIAPPDDEDTPKGGKPASDYEDEEDISAAEFVSTLAPEVQKLYEQSVAINSTAFEAEENGQVTFIGSKTETALLGFSRDHFGMGPVGIERSNASIVQLLPFDSARKCMAVVVKLDDKTFRMYVKGASEILLRACTEIIRDPTKEISHVSITHENIATLNRVITAYASRSLRTIGLLYRDFSQWPPSGARTLRDDPSQAYFDDIFKNMVFLGIVGIQDPLREGVKEAVMTCRHAGVFVRMVTGDNVLTAKAIGQECGIYTKGGLVMEGPIFRRLGRTEMREIIPRLQVLARSSPKDKEILVERLKDMGETVAVTGDGTNDVPALKKADVGFSMGISGTEVAKEASSIILMDDNFASIVKAMAWGRAVNDAVRKFLQFQVTVNITAVILTFVSAVASSSETSVLTAVQLLWVNLIMDTFAALALATDPPLPSILDRKPDPKSAPLITITMWKMIIGQTIYQLVVTLILNFGATSILSYTSARELSQLQTLVFNTFVWMQIFNQWK